ncbi:MAG: hypothetical protein Q8Q09_13670 [Deltaproteobacteria bacterium]|nr:hypothetical protein [Deltaproteobacteria bacterium]
MSRAVHWPLVCIFAAQSCVHSASQSAARAAVDVPRAASPASVSSERVEATPAAEVAAVNLVQPEVSPADLQVDDTPWTSWVLANGLRVQLHTRPLSELVHVRVVLRDARPLAARVACSLQDRLRFAIALETVGTRRSPEAEFRREIERLGADVRVDVGHDRWVIAADVRAPHAEALLRRLGELVREPLLQSAPRSLSTYLSSRWSGPGSSLASASRAGQHAALSTLRGESLPATPRDLLTALEPSVNEFADDSTSVELARVMLRSGAMSVTLSGAVVEADARRWTALAFERVARSAATPESVSAPPVVAANSQQFVSSIDGGSYVVLAVRLASQGLEGAADALLGAMYSQCSAREASGVTVTQFDDKRAPVWMAIAPVAEGADLSAVIASLEATRRRAVDDPCFDRASVAARVAVVARWRTRDGGSQASGRAWSDDTEFARVTPLAALDETAARVARSRFASAPALLVGVGTDAMRSGLCARAAATPAARWSGRAPTCP